MLSRKYEIKKEAPKWEDYALGLRRVRIKQNNKFGYMYENSVGALEFVEDGKAPEVTVKYETEINQIQNFNPSLVRNY